MLHDPHKDPLTAKAFFWFRADVGEIDLKKFKGYPTLSDILEKHPIFKTKNKKDELYLGQGSIIPTLDRHIPFWMQMRPLGKDIHFPYQPIQSEATVENILETVSNLWGTYDGPSLKFGGNAITAKFGQFKTQVKLTFNTEAQRTYSHFMAHIQTGLSSYGFNDYTIDLLKQNIHRDRELKVTLAKRNDRHLKNPAREAFMSAVALRFDDIKTKPITIDRLTLGQGYYDINGKPHQKQDIAHIDSDGGITWAIGANAKSFMFSDLAL